MRQNGNVEGAFLVRDHSRSPGDFVLSVVQGTKPQHYVVSTRHHPGMHPDLSA